MFGKPWLKRNFKEKQFGMSVSYVVKHLDPMYKQRITSTDSWQTTKTEKVLEYLEKDPHYVLRNPPRLVLHDTKELFRVDDGISRLRACLKKGIKTITIILRHGDW
jgi:hypothetical protein